MDLQKNNIEYVEGLYQCNRCKNRYVQSISKQTRTGDEGESVSLSCSVCGQKRYEK